MYQRASVLGWEGEQTTSAKSFRMPGSARPILRDELSLLGHGQPGIESPLESSGLPLLVYRQLVSLANSYVTLQPLHEQVGHSLEGARWLRDGFSQRNSVSIRGGSPWTAVSPTTFAQTARFCEELHSCCPYLLRIVLHRATENPG